MSFVTAHPELLTAAAGNLAGIGDAMTTGVTAAAPATTAVAPPAIDPISALTSVHFSTHGAMFQAVSAQAAAVHQQIVATLNGNAANYAATEAANAVIAG